MKTMKFDKTKDTMHVVGDANFPQVGRLFQVGPNGQFVRVVKFKSSGEMFADVGGRGVPRDICGLAAGKDVWMRKILFRCEECRTRTTAESLECGLCETCYDKAGEENAIADGNV